MAEQTPRGRRAEAVLRLIRLRREAKAAKQDEEPEPLDPTLLLRSALPTSDESPPKT